MTFTNTIHIYNQVYYLHNFTNSAILIFMHVFLYRVQCPAAEVEGFDPGYYSQYQRCKAA